MADIITKDGKAYLMICLGEEDDMTRCSDTVATVRPVGNSKGVAMGRTLSSIGADIGDEVRVIIIGL